MQLDPYLLKYIHESRFPEHSGPADIQVLRDGSNNQIKYWHECGVKSLPVDSVKDFHIDREGLPIPVRLYRPNTRNPIAICIFLHGGGWTIGDLESHDDICRALCEIINVSVLSVDYRLAPEHRFPAALEDSIFVAKWAHKNKSVLGSKNIPLIICGDSSGGNLAAVTSLCCGHNLIDAQVLFYPVTDLPDSGHHSFEEFENGYSIGANLPLYMQFYQGYVGSKTPRQVWKIAPLRAPDLHRSPPTFILTVYHDFLRDEGDAFAFSLRKAGVNTHLAHLPDVNHGFLHWVGVLSQVETTLNEVKLWLEQTVGFGGRD